MTEPTATASHAAAAGSGSQPGRGRRRPVGAWVVAATAVAVAVALFGLWFRLAQQRAADADVAQVAGRAIAALTNWESDQLADVQAAIEELATAGFRDEVRELLDRISQDLAATEARSSGEILDLVGDAGTRPGAGDTGVALAVVRQEVTSTALDASDVQCWGARAVVNHVDGRWLIDALELYGANQCPEEAT
ncbi:MAG: hypothetical protein KY462_05660 [Actinobacteria bacterium]|nr:hypothetical protein [Actinomycetota bacterium]